MRPFDITTASLEPGVTLIEASAGTGKTYSITGLILRLILEENVSIGRILAVTFTEAATEELRDRVQERLRRALEDLRRSVTKDEIVQSFRDRNDVALGIRRLEVALQSFDEAQIFTIHGFCQRMLNDYAFESGARFETALVTDPLPLFQEIARDFWRHRFYRTDPLFPILATAWQRSPDDWVDLLEQTRRHPDLTVIPATALESCDNLLSRIEKAFTAVTKEWKRRHLEIEKLLRTHGSLSQSAGSFRDDRVTDLLAGMADAAKGFRFAQPINIRAIEGFSSEAIAAGTKPSCTPPADRFFELCTDFQRSVETLFSWLAHEFLAFAKSELPKRKAKTNTVTYDDLITGLRDALRLEGGKILAQRIGQRYSAALIDEFQDTDPAQYEIFRTLFRTSDHRLFFIGDPKQAIYGFRGADVFTYFEAARIAERRFTLTRNWRSEENLINAVNKLFQQASEPFVLPWIEYHEVHYPSEPQARPLVGRDQDKSLTFRLLQSGKDKKKRDRRTPIELISFGVSNEIALLKESGASIDTRPLRYSDMAVLVRRYSQADEVQKALRARGIRSIVQSDQNVFSSKEAREMQQFLQGLIDPRRDPQLKAALATSLLGFDARALFELDQNDRLRQEWLDRFAFWRQRWARDSFMAMFRDLAVLQNLRSRMVELPGGERRLTNVLHLAELLHDAESSGSLTPDALCTWLREQRENLPAEQDRFQLRLESDEEAVQIVTVHRAKGLEYPIVFCPFLWTRAENPSHQELLFHDRNANNRLTFDLRGKSGGTEEHRAWQSQETVAEELRLLYVAVTRARNRCYIYLPEKIEKSPLAQLLQPSKTESAVDRINQVAASCKDGIAIGAIDTELPDESPSQLHQDIESNLPVAHSFSSTIPRAAVATSFSGLNVTEIEQIEANITDDITTATLPDDDPDISILTFDRGRRTGDFFHDVLEQMDFQNLDGLPELVESRLGIYGFARTSHRRAIHQLLEQLPGIELKPGLRLRDVSGQDRIAECEFCFPLAHLTPAVLAKNVSRWKNVPSEMRTRIGKLSFDPIEGFLRGIIDLLFRHQDRYYLVDWKSNWLGNQGSDYGTPGMEQAMLKHNYYLQYHLYTLAIDLFLSERVPGYSYETHFGGVFYIFLRGIDPGDSMRGIFRDRPEAKTIATLRKLTS